MIPSREALADAAAVALLVARPASTVRWWAQEGLIRPAGRDGRRVLYRVGDVIDVAARRTRIPA